jgi:hypothetical protein
MVSQAAAVCPGVEEAVAEVNVVLALCLTRTAVAAVAAAVAGLPEPAAAEEREEAVPSES